ncbi:MAG TPA: phosphatase PAP2 family protein [Povalibacter sp.]
MLGLTALMAVSPGHAGDLGTEALLEDTRQYFSAPLHWDSENWLYLGATVLAVGVAHEYDDDVRAHFLEGGHAVAAGDDPNSLQHALPAAIILAGTLTAAALTHDSDGYNETWAMAEASALSGVTALALKYTSGRQRPNDTDDVDDWFSGGGSFPSLHTTLAFSIGTVLAESGNDRYRWVRRTLGYGMAAGTAYLRLRDNVHWLSDTVAGAALGIASAEFSMNRRTGRQHHATMMLEPLEDGVMLSYSVPLR